MKIIDLLNKIANGEDIKAFMLDGEEYKVEKGGFLKTDDFIVDEDGDPVRWTIYKDWLNEEVEILDKPSKKRKTKIDDEIDKKIEELAEMIIKKYE